LSGVDFYVLLMLYILVHLYFKRIC